MDIRRLNWQNESRKVNGTSNGDPFSSWKVMFWVKGSNDGDDMICLTAGIENELSRGELSVGRGGFL